MEIRKVTANKQGVKTVTVPKNCGIEPGDYIKIIKINLKDLEGESQ